MSTNYQDFTEILDLSPQARTICQNLRSKYPYRFGSGYINYKTFSEVFAVVIMAARTTLPPDMISHHLGRQADVFDRYNTPIYTLDRTTFELFSDSLIANTLDLFAGANSNGEPRHYCILLPSSAFLTEPGASLEVLWIESFNNNTDTELESALTCVGKGIYGSKLAPGSTYIGAGGIDTNGTLWGAKTVYPEPTSSEKLNLGGIDTVPTDDEVLDRLRDLSLQIIMSIEYLPEAIEVVAPTSRTRGFSKSAPAETIWYPRKISIERKRYLKSDAGESYAEGEKSRNSPRPHWRKFHWRRVATGTGRTQREWRLIQRTYVKNTISN
jgi:hypothetical protein